MKKTFAFMLAMVLTLSLFTGCGCRNSAPANTSEPTLMPTVETSAPTTQATTEATTMATTEPTTNATIEDGNGPISTDATAGTDGMADGNARSRSGMIGGATGNGISGSIG